MTQLFKNIKSLHGILENNNKPLRGREMDNFNFIENAFLTIHNGVIQNYGTMNDLDTDLKFETTIDCEGKLILPSYCDSHTHLVYATSREEEFADRIKGLTYEEIAAKGGGILNSARKLASKTEDELFEDAMKRLYKLIQLGTGAIEIKSGYGLSVDAELKILRVIKRIKEASPIPVKATFLGAHAFPQEYKENHPGYIDLIIHEMLPIIAKEDLADYIDVFCEKNYFTIEQTKQVVMAGKKIGLKPKIHVNQFNAFGGIKNAVELGAISVDHLEVMNEDDIAALRKSETIGTALPSCSFFLNIPYAPIKNLIKKDIAIALATDYNPGSTPSGNMNFVVSLACIHQKITPEQAFNAATINGAYAMEVNDQLGSITKGKVANFFITEKVKSLSYLPYSFGENCIDSVYINGKLVN